MDLKLEIKSELESGSWAVRDLADRFRHSLAHSLGRMESRHNLTELSLAFYRRYDLSQVTLAVPDKGLKSCLKTECPSASIAIEKVMCADYLECFLSRFPSAEVDKIERAVAFIKDADLELHRLIDDSISMFIRLSSARFRSASHPHLFGSILIGDGVDKQSAEEIAVSIVHEFAHQELFLVNLIDRLVNREFDFNEIHAPFQGRARPPIGRLHSMWALYRMVQFQKISGKVDESHRQLLSRSVKSFQAGELTKMASDLVAIASKVTV